jgi:multidrug efflux pump subunit AcrB
MWIVRLALRRPYTFVVLALLLLLSGGYVARKTPTDIFPAIDIPILSVVWSYQGLPAQQMEQQITQFSEYTISGNVSNVRSIESQTFDGVSVVRVGLQPGASVPAAIAEITAASQSIVRRMPPGTTPPVILRYSASSVPVIQITFSSDSLSESEIFDHVNQRVRTMLSVVRGTRFPLPMGGKTRQISVDLDLAALRELGLAPQDVALAISAQNLTLPTGSAKIGETEFRVSLNASPEVIAALNDVPVRKVGDRTIFVRDVAHVHDGFAVQTNIARVDGKRAVVLSVMKTGDASTTEVAERVRDMLPTIQGAAPPGMKVELLADQSTFVTGAVHGLLTEGLIAAALTAAMILLFLGSVRSTLIVAVSIPLSVLAALLVMRLFLGETLNVMTLGGFALAVGILVDDATVEIENIHRNLAMGKTLPRAILDGAEQVAVPAFVASSSIAIVFVSLVFLDGPARFLFVPLGEAVGLSVMASYLLSRTLVPTLVRHLLEKELESHGVSKGKKNVFVRFQEGFEGSFERFRVSYTGLLAWCLDHRKTTLGTFAVVSAGAAVLALFVGRDFFPQVDGGKIRLHVVTPPGTRIEETEARFAEVEASLRKLIPAKDRTNIIDQIGMPGGYNLAITDSANVSSSDGEIFIGLAEHGRKPTKQYVDALRSELPKQFPDLRFYFQPADIVTQILNFGLPSPIDVQVSGQKRDLALKTAKAIEAELRGTQGAVDVRLFQITNAPDIHVNVDRLRANEAGLTERDIANNLLLVVSSSGQVTPAYYVNLDTGLSYPISTQVPDWQVSSMDALAALELPTRNQLGDALPSMNLPGIGTNGHARLADLATFERRNTPVFITHKEVQPTYDVQADIAHSDLGTVVDRLDKIVAKYKKDLPAGTTIQVKGQAASMSEAFTGLGLGLALAALLVYALMVVNFQSWVDPFVILFALPGAASGIVLSLFATQTTFSIPSLMGALTSVGVATANAILVVAFANEQRATGKSALAAALEAGRVRLRPVVMTALAMAIGMLPMSLGLSEGGEQNAALGRAVLGGIFGATVATLLVVPVVYAVLKKNAKPRHIDPELRDPDDEPADSSLTVSPEVSHA